MSNISGMFAAVQGVGSVLSGITQSNATNQQGIYAEKQFGLKAQLAQLMGDQAGIEGVTALQAAGLQSRREMGQARASFASQGVTSTSGSVQNAESEISNINTLNASTIKNQVWQRQFGYSFQSMQDIQAGAMARLNAKNTANAQMTAGILGGLNYGVKAGEDFYQASKANPPSGNVGTRMNPPDVPQSNLSVYQ